MLKSDLKVAPNKHLNPINFKPINPFIKVHGDRSRMTENRQLENVPSSKSHRKENSMGILENSELKMNSATMNDSFDRSSNKYERYFSQILSQNHKLLEQI